MIPRIHNLDLEWAKGVKEFCQRARADFASNPPESQVDWALAAGYASDLAFLEYGLGEQLAIARAHLGESLEALTKVFELRATSVIQAVSHVGGLVIPEAPQLDYSLTNSKRGLWTMYLALVCGPQGAARKVASLVSDPSDASYIGKNSVVCTPEDQELAYFLKALLLDDTPSLTQSEPSSQGRLFERFMMEAIWVNQPGVFLDNLSRVLLWYASEQQGQEHYHDPSWLICIPGLALLAYALSRDLVTEHELPNHNPYLPLDLLRTNAASN